MRHHIDRGPEGDERVSGVPFGLRQAGKQGATGGAIGCPALRAGFQVGGGGRLWGPVVGLRGAHDPGAIDRHAVTQFRVNPRAVQAFRVILPEPFPVALQDHRMPVASDKPLHRPVVQRLQRHIGPQGPWFRRGVQEHEPGPEPHLHGPQPMRGAVEIRGGAGVGGADKVAILGRKGEGVIGAADQLAQRLLVRTQFRAPVRAGVMPGPDGAPGVARQDHRGVAQKKGPHRSRRQIAQPPRADPLAPEHRPHLVREPARVQISGAGQARGAMVQPGREGVGHHTLPAGVARLRAGLKKGRSTTRTGSISLTYCNSRRA